MRTTFRTRLLVSYVLLIVVPLVTAGIIFYNKSLEVVVGQAQQNVQSIVVKNNEIIDTKLGIVDRNSQALFVDRQLFELFNTLDTSDEAELLAADRIVGSALRSYFAQIEDVYAYQLWTSYFTYGQTLPQGKPQDSDIYHEAQEAGGKTVWYPTYDFADMFGQAYLDDSRLDFQYLYSATRVVDFSYLSNSSLERLGPDVERPVLAVSFKADSLTKLFEQSIPANSRYMVIDRSNVIVAGSDTEAISTRYEGEWTQELHEEGSGTRRMTLDGEAVIICFDRSKVTGWLSIVITPESVLAQELVPVIRTSTVLLSLVMGAVALALAYFISGKITNPIKRLLGAMRSVGEGDFHTQLDVRSSDEFGLLIQRFNRMNDRIRLLVTENYESRLKEQEAEIRALNMQMNPHFLYNTLNVMNWTAIENGQKELSKMLVCLSHMLQYTTRKEWSSVRLAEELEWMKSYFYIMSARFEDKFTVHYDIDPELYDCKLPRLLFQPFVENAILHGFVHLETGGIIHIRARKEGGDCLFEVEDNGKGMRPEAVQAILEKESASIGINNTIARIRLAYGERYGVDIISGPGEGTRIVITLPHETN
ncbi:sensor histidine kinase [Paenibacillus agaridevorans]|uniref:sensor histidine kinase n=1 Tax=Paenibacillus agaridevorans TaxID=171404 RepID=UPI001BE48ECC|nr:sensor histidine kinase [Paenibacillus agaridevorans]